MLSPIPEPSSFVEKKGIKILSILLIGIPSPLSANSKIIYCGRSDYFSGIGAGRSGGAAGRTGSHRGGRGVRIDRFVDVWRLS